MRIIGRLLSVFSILCFKMRAIIALFTEGNRTCNVSGGQCIFQILMLIFLQTDSILQTRFLHTNLFFLETETQDASSTSPPLYQVMCDCERRREC